MAEQRCTADQTFNAMDELRATADRRKKQSASSTTPAADQAEPNVYIAYAYLLIGGFWGLHHLYLGRPLQAGLWACSPGLGGFFGLGIWSDVLKVPYYAQARGSSAASQALLEAEMKYNKVPGWSTSRVCGCYAFGRWFALIGSSCSPAGLPSGAYAAIGAYAGALGVWLAGNACTHQGGSLKWASAGAALGFLLGYPVLCSVLAFQWTRYWEPEPVKSRPASWKVVLAVLLFWGFAFNGVYQHASITVETGRGPKTFTLRDTFWNIVHGLEFDDFQKFDFGFGDDDSSSWDNSWEKRWQGFANRLDVQGERRALKTLGMESFIGKLYSEVDVNQHYKDMAKRWHPDRAPRDQLQEAEKRMQEINGAKELLMGILHGT